MYAADHRGHHRLVADEPQPIGDDKGPTPDDLLLAALGACTSMTVRMYADRKGWQLDRAEITLRHKRIHAQDCADCETKAGWMSHVDRDIELTGDSDDVSTPTVDAHRRTLPCPPDADLGI